MVKKGFFNLGKDLLKETPPPTSLPWKKPRCLAEKWLQLLSWGVTLECVSMSRVSWIMWISLGKVKS